MESKRRRSKTATSFDTIVSALQSTQPGQERNMYPFIRDLFVHILGFKTSQVFVDTSAQEGIPDVAVHAPTGVQDQNGKDISGRWLVLEAKDESIFLDDTKRNRIFTEKSKYIELDTAWFAFVDPKGIVLRPVTSRSASYDSSQDIVIQWEGVSEEDFRNRAIYITAENAGTNRRLTAFRDGDERHIAEVKLNASGKLLSEREELRLERARNEFYVAMRTSAVLLQNACRHALESLLPEIDSIRSALTAFDSAYGIREFQIYPFNLHGARIENREAFLKHRRDIRVIHDLVKKNSSLVRLAWFTFPEFLQRAENKRDRALELLAAETASLILARSMMLRFFEDHGFFGEKRHICNGGVKAFQEMRRHFGTSYARLLRESYAEGSKVYSAVFSEGELDWVLSNPNAQLSSAIERVLFYLSHFDFATIEQDVLSNIYGQFMDTSQRKRLGEHYTPPDIARYIVRQLGLKPGDKVIDPACGLGTFLIEAFRFLAGDAAEKGVGTFEQITATLQDVRGNDINSFSSMVAQIQLLWHLFIFRDDIKKHGFPETNITGGYNSLRRQHVLEDLFDSVPTEFSLLDTPEYAAVVGNPPYVRPERQEANLLPEDAAFFEDGVSSKIDLYSLFLYKAMEGWCRPANGNPPGKLGFVLPLSFCDNDDNRQLRKLFALGGKWRIIEIVDLELIGPLVFTADVVPIILIAERRPATPEDKIRLRVADERCARFTGLDEKHVAFDINQSPAVELPYADVFSADGRILTKLTPRRKQILDRFKGQTFDDIALRFWVGKSKNEIVKWSLTKPSEADDLRWEESSMIRMGAAFRGSIHHVDKGGRDIIKGENIVACRIEGDPVETKIDVDKMDDSSLWRFSEILPSQGFAFHRISTALTCAPFEPASFAVLNTATLLFPKTELASFPFDFLVLSHLYQYVFAVGNREAVLFRARCNVYPTTLRRLPWTPSLENSQSKISELRTQFLSACENLHQRTEVLLQKLKEHGHTTLKQAVTASDSARVEWSEELNAGKQITITDPIIFERDGWFVIQPSGDLLNWIAIKDEAVARAFVEGLKLQTDEKHHRASLMEVPIPTPKTLPAWRKTVSDFDKKDYEKSIAGILDKLDRIVAKAFKISDEDLEFIKTEFQSDPMLRRVKPNLPFTDRQLKGLRKGLEDPKRYDKAYETRG